MRKKKADASNPIARAYAVKRMKEAVVSHRISIFMLDEDQSAESEITATSLPVFAMMYCLEELKEEESIEYRKLKSAVNVLLECSGNGFKWKRNYAITLDNALGIAQDRWGKIPQDLLSRAVNYLSVGFNQSHSPRR
jgi:hypothetical protein